MTLPFCSPLVDFELLKVNLIPYISVYRLGFSMSAPLSTSFPLPHFQFSSYLSVTHLSSYSRSSSCFFATEVCLVRVVTGPSVLQQEKRQDTKQVCWEGYCLPRKSLMLCKHQSVLFPFLLLPPWSVDPGPVGSMTSDNNLVMNTCLAEYLCLVHLWLILHQVYYKSNLENEFSYK